MKAIIPTLAIAFSTLFSTENAMVLPSEPDFNRTIEIPDENTSLNRSGIEFDIKPSDVNTKYSEFSSGLFRGKLIVVSSKKIGGLGNGLDSNTKEPFTELFCMDIDENGEISNPLLFSRILNTKHNEGQVAFSPDEKTIYYTRALRENSKNYQLFKATLEKNSHGNWINIQQLTRNNSYSIEFPYVSPDGKTLLFASNKPGGYGGYDLYKAEIQPDGTLGIPELIDASINTPEDETYPSMSSDGRTLYFSSNGHPGFGGMDLFMSAILNDSFDLPQNLGDQINSSYDEVAMRFVDEELGFFSSNRTGGKGSFDMYQFRSELIEHTLQGIIVDSGTNQPLPNARVVLLDKAGKELSVQTTGVDAHFSFAVKAFEEYKVKILKSGFDENEFAFQATDVSDNRIYKKVLKLSAISNSK
ncbi:MAG: hypothetical protein HKO90_11460 [Flavobacteriaceae bacterium]|nr:PD40 domain-containing protein [Bacteroidia bacterium]NNK88892.1 hypothetical protein [Flavobacteriaceae bacterium]